MATVWTCEMDAIVKRDFNVKSLEEIASELGVTPAKVRHRAYVIGVYVPAKSPPLSLLVERIKSMHLEGKTNIEIAASFKHGVQHDRVGYLRRSLGMDAPLTSKRKFWRAWKRSLGWPEHLAIRSVQALETFWRLKVPLTREQICLLMGVSTKRSALMSRRGNVSVFGELIQEGFISRLEAAHKRRSLYFLNAGVMPSDSRSEPFEYEISGDDLGETGVLVRLPARLDFVATKAPECDGQRNNSGGHDGDRIKASREGKSRRRQSRQVSRLANRQRRSRDLVATN